MHVQWKLHAMCMEGSTACSIDFSEREKQIAVSHFTQSAWVCVVARVCILTRKVFVWRNNYFVNYLQHNYLVL